MSKRIAELTSFINLGGGERNRSFCWLPESDDKRKSIAWRSRKAPSGCRPSCAPCQADSQPSPEVPQHPVEGQEGHRQQSTRLPPSGSRGTPRPGASEARPTGLWSSGPISCWATGCGGSPSVWGAWPVWSSTSPSGALSCCPRGWSNGPAPAAPSVSRAEAQYLVFLTLVRGAGQHDPAARPIMAAGPIVVTPLPLPLSPGPPSALTPQVEPPRELELPRHPSSRVIRPMGVWQAAAPQATARGHLTPRDPAPPYRFPHPLRTSRTPSYSPGVIVAGLARPYSSSAPTAVLVREPDPTGHLRPRPLDWVRKALRIATTAGGLRRAAVGWIRRFVPLQASGTSPTWRRPGAPAAGAGLGRLDVHRVTGGGHRRAAPKVSK
jgi:hypothetical protein